jgi:hypothetical protein
VLRVTFREEAEQQDLLKPDLGIMPPLMMVIAVAIFLWAFALSVPLYAGSENVVILEGELPAKDPPALVHAFVAQEDPSPLSFLVAVLDLARRGYVRLMAHSEGLIIQPLKPAEASLHPHEQYLLDYLATDKSERVKLKGTLSPAFIQFPTCLDKPTFIQFLKKFYLLLEEEVQKLGRIPTKSWRYLFGNFLCFVGILLYFSVYSFTDYHVRDFMFSPHSLPYFILLSFILTVIYHFKSLKWLILLLLIWLFLSLFFGIYYFTTPRGVVSIFSGYFWSETFPLLISVPLFFLSGYLFLHSYRYTVLGKDRKKQWERFREWLAELPMAPSEVAKHVEVYIPYAVALGAMKPLLSYVSQNLGTQPAPSWLEIPPNLMKLPQEEGASTQMSPTLSDALRVVENNIDMIYQKIQKIKSFGNKEALSDINEYSFSIYYAKMKINDLKEQVIYRLYYLVAHAMMIFGLLMAAPSIYLLVRGFEGLGWEGVIYRMAYLLVGLLFIVGGWTLRTWVKREEKTVKMTEKLRSLWQLLKDRGKMKMEEIAMHLGVSKSEVPKWVYRLASSEAFMGYVDWKDGVLYSADASVLGEGKGCPQCGGQLEPAGKGLFRCQHCGSEVFLKKPVLH